VETPILERGRYMVSNEISISGTQTTLQNLSQRPFFFQNEKEEGNYGTKVGHSLVVFEPTIHMPPTRKDNSMLLLHKNLV
jgi:hypothetical protein